MQDQINAINNGMKHAVTKAANVLCGLCANPYPYMCSECNDFDDPKVDQQVKAAKPVRRSIIGAPDDFLLYV